MNFRNRSLRQGWRPLNWPSQGWRRWSSVSLTLGLPKRQSRCYNPSHKTQERSGKKELETIANFEAQGERDRVPVVYVYC